MHRPAGKVRSTAWGALASLVLLAGCQTAPVGDPLATTLPQALPTEPQIEARPALGLMTSLPLYWPLGTGIADLASGAVDIPWQRAALEAGHDLVALDTLSKIAGLTDAQPETDPLAEFDRLAVIQPRGLSPADNVALDDWVRAGGQLLIVLDPALTGHYGLPLGDPRGPTATALIPPVIARWGLEVVFDEAQDPVREVALGETRLPVSLAGEVRVADPAARERCTIAAQGIVARCAVGAGRVTLLADATAFEHRTGDGHSHDEVHQHGSSAEGDTVPLEETTGPAHETIVRLLDLAFGP